MSRASDRASKEQPQRVRLAIVSTHPIQYYAPVFRALAQSSGINVKVFYTWSQAAEGPVFDPGFGKRFTWDVPLLDGYEFAFVPNVAKHPGVGRFDGIRNPALISMIEEWGADAVLIYGWNLYSHLSALRHFKGRIPVLFRGDSTLIDRQPALRRKLRKMYLSWVYSHIDWAIAVGQNNRAYYRWAGVAGERVAFAPHSVDTVRFGDPDGEHAQLAARWRLEMAIPRDSVVFVFAAKFIAKKDPTLLLDAFLELRSAAHLILVGDGELESSLRDRADGNSTVHFLPFQNQYTMPAVYRLGDVYVLPSCGPGETWGLAMNEAMASGRPVIASTRVGGATDLIEEGVTGWQFEAASRADLIRALRRALASGREGLQTMGEQAQKLSANWSTAAAADAIAATVARACGAPQ